MAEPAARCALPDCLLRCPEVEDPRRGHGQEQGGLSRPGHRCDRAKDVLGLWIEHTEGAKFWLKVFSDLKKRGLDDILIAVVDGLRGFPEAIEAVYPQTQIQTCIVHLIRNSLDLWVEGAQGARLGIEVDLPTPSAELAEVALWPLNKARGASAGPRSRWLAPAVGAGHPVLRLPARACAGSSTPPTPSRALNAKLRRAVRARGHFPSRNTGGDETHLSVPLRQVANSDAMRPVIPI